MLKRRFFLFAVSMALMTPTVLCAWHNLDPDSERRWLRPPNEWRAYVKITNDWRDAVRLSMWTRRGTQIGSFWTIRSGQSGYLKDGGERLTATQDYNIRVGDAPEVTRLGDVGERRGDVWYINVRDVWQATHPHGRGGGEDEGIDQGF